MIKERIGMIYDAHVPYHDTKAYDLATKYLANLKRPKLTKLLIAGDFVDFYMISSWKNDPNRMEFKDEINIIQNHLRRLRKTFSRIPIHYLEGNHETRLNRYIWGKAPEFTGIIDVPQLLRLSQRRIKYISNIALMCEGYPPYKVGKLYVLHGHELKVGMGSMNIARLYYLKAHKNIIVGHHHRSQKYMTKTINQKHEGSWTVGTLGQLSEPYLPVNDWNHGFAYVDLYEDGFFDVHNKAIIEGNVVTA